MKKYVPKISRKAPTPKVATTIQKKGNGTTFFTKKTTPNSLKQESVIQKKTAFFSATKINLTQTKVVQRASSSLQDKIIESAESKKGKIEAKHYENNAWGSPNNLQSRQLKRHGYEHLLEIFKLAAPGMVPDSSVIYDNTVNQKSIPSWCGIFALYANKKAGAGVGTWQIGKSIPTIEGFKPVAGKPKKGDVGIMKGKENHHLLVKDPGDGTKFKSIDGNSGMFSEVVENPREYKNMHGFFQVPSIQPKLKIGAPNDRYEREADAVADKVAAQKNANSITNTSLQTVQRKCDGCKENKMLQLKRGNLPPPVRQEKKRNSIQRNATQEKTNANLGQLKTILHESQSEGNHLPRSVQEEYGSKMGADFSNVRIHTDTKADVLNKELNAKAFAYGNHIYFAQGNYSPDSYAGRHLLAHELTHTIQQGAAKPVAPETEGQRVLPVAHSPPAVQMKQEDEGFVETELWAKLGQYISADTLQILRDIRHSGIFEYISNKIKSAVTSVFNTFNIDPKILEKAQSLFEELIPLLKIIIDGLKKNDCKPLFAAMGQLKTFLNKIIGDAWKKISEKLDPVVEYLENIWQTYAAPVIEKIKAFATDIWEKFKGFALKAWEMYKTHIKNQIGMLKWGWDKLKGWLGLNDSENSNEEGFVDWVKRKLGEVWEKVQVKLKPIIDPVKKVLSAIKDLLPWNFINTLKEKAQKFLDDMGKMATAMEGDDTAIAKKQATFRGTILPAIKTSVVNVSKEIVAAGKWVNSKVGMVKGAVLGFFTKLESIDLLSAVVSIIAPLKTKVNELSDWVITKVDGAFTSASNAVLLVNKFIEPVLNTLEKMVGVISNVMGRIMDFVLGPFKLIPKCISDPIITWLIENVFKKIPILGTIFTLPEYWPKIKARAMQILVAVFVDGDLRKALWLLFKSGLEILGIPPSLVIGIVKKAAAVFGDILKNPLNFFKNLLLAARDGVVKFFDNIGTHLLTGFQGWLFGELTENGIALPTKWDFQGIIGFVMDIFNINLERFLKKLEEHPKIKGTQIVPTIRKAVHLFTKSLPWIKKLIEQGPKGIWDEFKAKMKDFDFVGFLISSAISWLTQKLVQKATEWLISLCDVTGITPIIKSCIAIYDTIQEIVKRAKEILKLIDTVLDGLGSIVKGAIEVGANFVEKALAKSLPLGISLAAAAAGLGGIGKKIKEILDKVNLKIDEAIDKIINGAVDLILSAWQVIKQVASTIKDKIMGWWKAKVDFTGNDNKAHKIYFKGDENSAVMTIESKPMTFQGFLDEYGKNIPDDKKKLATEAAKDIDEFKKSELVYDKSGTEEQQKEKKKAAEEVKAEEMKKKIEVLANILKDYFGTGAAKNEIKDEESKTAEGFGQTAFCEELDKDHRAGSQPVGSAPDKYVWMNQRKTPSKSFFYIKGHLMNDNLGGRGIWTNMTPLPGSENTRFEQEIESRSKRSVESGATIKFKATANYGRSDGYTSKSVDDIKDDLVDDLGLVDPSATIMSQVVFAERFVPVSISMDAHILELKDGKYTKKEPINTGDFNVEIPNRYQKGGEAYYLPDSPAFIPVNVSCGDKKEYKRLGLSDYKAGKIRKLLMERKQAFGTQVSFSNAANIKIETVNKWYSEGKITFGDCPLTECKKTPATTPTTTTAPTTT